MYDMVNTQRAHTHHTKHNVILRHGDRPDRHQIIKAGRLIVMSLRFSTAKINCRGRLVSENTTAVVDTPPCDMKDMSSRPKSVAVPG